MSEGIKITCTCGAKFDIEKTEEMQNHVRSCAEYLKKSPIAKDFKKIHVNDVSYSDLSSIKCEYLNYIDQIDKKLNLSSHFLDSLCEIKRKKFKNNII